MRTTVYRLSQLALMTTMLLLWSVVVMAQDRRITGKVTGADGPVPGVNIVIKGTTTGTTTDANGQYTLNLRGNNPSLIISAIGYKGQEVAVGNRTTLDITLEDDATALSEVIVTGYSTTNKRDATGAVATVKAKDLTVVPSGSNGYCNGTAGFHQSDSGAWLWFVWG
jgi:TonB-dependent starch-binding outer membrane protein SusC